MDNIQTRPEPFNWSKYDRTGNNAIDLVAQAVGYHRQAMKPLKAIILKPTSFELFRAGIKILMKRQGSPMSEDPAAVLLFDNIEIKRGNHMQFDTMKFEYHPRPTLVN